MIIAGAANPHVRNYYSGLKDSECIKLLAISDFDTGRREYAKKAFAGTNVQIYSDWKEMFDQHPEAEAVMPGADNLHHFEIIKEAMLRKKNIYSMKVISMDEDECKEIIALRNKQNVVFQVELELHFGQQYNYIKRIVREGKLGKIKSIYLSNISICPICVLPNWGDPVLSYGRKVPLWPGAEIYRGGALTDHPHPFDLIHWITGYEIKKVFAISGRNQRDYLKVEDHVAITGELDNGIKFFINPSYSKFEEKMEPNANYRFLSPNILEAAVKITGSKGYAAVDYFDKHIYILGNKYERAPNRLFVERAPRTPYKEQDLLMSFALAVRGKRKVESSAEDGLRAIRAMNAAYKSISTGEMVYLNTR
jgi:predicted dehydrogenase